MSHGFVNKIMCFVLSFKTYTDTVLLPMNKTSFTWGIELVFSANLSDPLKYLYTMACIIFKVWKQNFENDYLVYDFKKED